MQKKRHPFSYNSKRLRLLVVFFSFIFLLTSCGGAKNFKGSSTANSSLATKKIIAFHEAASPDFKTLAARVQVVYETEDRQQSITTSLRMEKDKTIWIKASLLGITLAKVLITPERVSYYETIGNTYFDGDFEFLSELLGTKIDFQKAQAILLGQSIFNLNSTGYTSEVVQNKYKLLPKKQSELFIHSLLIDPDTFKIHLETLSQPSEQRLLTVRYGPYQMYGQEIFPSEVKIDASEKDSKTKIEVNYKKIDLNVSVSFPFTIPNGYDQIEL